VVQKEILRSVVVVKVGERARAEVADAWALSRKPGGLTLVV
jgi:hypothetical protein